MAAAASRRMEVDPTDSGRGSGPIHTLTILMANNCGACKEFKRTGLNQLFGKLSKLIDEGRFNIVISELPTIAKINEYNRMAVPIIPGYKLQVRPVEKKEGGVIKKVNRIFLPKDSSKTNINITFPQSLIENLWFPSFFIFTGPTDAINPNCVRMEMAEMKPPLQESVYGWITKTISSLSGDQGDDGPIGVKNPTARQPFPDITRGRLTPKIPSGSSSAGGMPSIPGDVRPSYFRISYPESSDD